ncbi:hypothetical protein KVT40_008024 [Elsinoe batatas]|uniref:Uncharacterized protein n=1 Tax=Elsinoe batatas TaxID=2601811 RepID=A0A8K0KZF8_9PEZI|nr:hypothetical protein KVT40_008024 [Elsinoe batatas]
MAASLKKNDPETFLFMLASTCGIDLDCIDQFKLAGLAGVKKTTVEPWVRDAKLKVRKINEDGIKRGILKADGSVNRDMVDEGRATGKKAKTKAGVEDEALHGVKAGKVTKAKGKVKKDTLVKSEEYDAEDDAD